MESKMKKNGDYALDFKKRVVREYLMGTSVADLQIKYNIKYQSNIARWIQKYSFGIQKQLDKIEGYIENNFIQDEIQQLEERIAELEKAIHRERIYMASEYPDRGDSAEPLFTMTN